LEKDAVYQGMASLETSNPSKMHLTLHKCLNVGKTIINHSQFHK